MRLWLIVIGGLCRSKSVALIPVFSNFVISAAGRQQEPIRINAGIKKVTLLVGIYSELHTATKAIKALIGGERVKGAGNTWNGRRRYNFVQEQFHQREVDTFCKQGFHAFSHNTS